MVYDVFNCMDIHQLELFLAVMDASSMTRAAEKFYLSPAAVSFQMHNLALELNSELFVRAGKKVSPTPAAVRLAQHARSILTLTGQIKQEFDDNPTKDTRPFHFATGVTTLIYQLAKPLRGLRKQYPAADIRVTVGVTEEIIAGLHERSTHAISQRNSRKFQGCRPNRHRKFPGCGPIWYSRDYRSSGRHDDWGGSWLQRRRMRKCLCA